MRTKKRFLLAWAVVGLVASAMGCGGKVTGYDPGDGPGEGGAGALSGTGGIGGVAGSGGTSDTGMGGEPAGADAGPSGGFGGAGGFGGVGAGGGSAECWSDLPPSTSCRGCVNSHCCLEVIKCFQDPDGFCATAFECFENCPDGDFFSCPGKCAGDPYNLPYDELLECGLINCYDECIGVP